MFIHELIASSLDQIIFQAVQRNNNKTCNILDSIFHDIVLFFSPSQSILGILSDSTAGPNVPQ